jgi:hypothetical protein
VLSARAAAAAAVAVVGLGGFATAAFAGALPASAQQFAHDAIGAPSPHSSGSAHHSGKDASARHSGTPVGPNATGPAEFGLCTAYANASEHGTATQKAIAFRNLEKAAGGAGNVASFCASVPHPGASVTRRDGATSRSHPTGAPSSHRTEAPSHS